MRNYSSENKFDLHENERAGETHFHMNGFARSKTRFDTEAKGNSEMACSLSPEPFVSRAKAPPAKRSDKDSR